MKNNWQTKKLKEICDIQTGKWDASHATEHGKYRFYTCAYEYGFCNTKRFSGECLILPGNGVNVGEVFYYKGDFDAYQRTYVINNIKIFPKYLNYHMLLFWKELGTKLQYGSATNFIKMGNFYDYDVAYPTLSEQQHIVNILDKVFEKTTKVKESAEKNLQNTQELLDNYLQSIFTNKSKGWEIKKLSEVAEYFNGLTYSPKNVSNKGIVVLRSSNVQHDDLDFSDIIRVDLTVKEKIKVQDGDILMCSRNGSKRLVGKTATIKNLKEVMTFGTFMMIIRGKNNPYLAWFFKSSDFRKQISGGENTMINQITRFMLDDITLSIPPEAEQKTIVQKLDALSAETKRLEVIYQQKLNDLVELKKSVLQKAFSGELIN